MNKEKCKDCDSILYKLQEYYTCIECGLVSDLKIIEHDTSDDNLINVQHSSFVPKGSRSYILKDSKYIYNDIYLFSFF